ncbi:MAG: class I SAM-dependent DNA methyltransferase [Promethearchaeota archaeon]
MGIAIRTEKDLIDVLEATITELEFYTKQIPLKILEKELNIFYVKNIDKKLLSESKNEEVKLAIYRLAAYIVISQLMFYNIIQKEVRTFKLPKLWKIADPSDLTDFFRRVMDEIGLRIIFRIDIASKLPIESKRALNDFIHYFSDMQLEKVFKRDLLGQIFQRLIPLTLRRRLAAFYTLPEPAKLLAYLAIDNKDLIVGDIACGSGTLLVHSYNRLKNLGNNSHKKLLQQLWGSDISAFACELATINLAIQYPFEFAEECNIIHEDAFKLKPGKLVSFFGRDTSSREESLMLRVSLNEKESENAVKIPYFDVLISNPPFTRGNRITSKYRDFLYRIMPAQIELDKIGIHACFLLYASNLLKKNGTLAFILPNSVTFAQAMESVIKEFQKIFSVKYLIRSEADSAFSDSELQEIMLIAQKNYEGDAKVVTLKKSLFKMHDNELNEIISFIKRKITINNDEISLRTIPYSQMKNTIVWKDLFSSSAIFDLISQNFVSISKYASSFQYHDPRPKECFRIPNKYWKIKDNTNHHILIQNVKSDRTLAIDKSFVSKTVHVLREAMDLDLSPMFNETDLKSYFFLGHKTNRSNGAKEYWDFYRKNWTTYENLASAGKLSKNPLGRWSVQINGFKKKRTQLMIVRKINLKNNRSIVFLCNKPILVGSGFYGIRTKNPDLAEFLFAYLSSSIFLLDFLCSRRIESGSVGQLLPKDLESRLVPKFEQIERKNKDKILSHSKEWNSISLSKRSNYLEMILMVKDDKNHPLRKLDEAWLHALDVSWKDKSEVELISKLYEEIVLRLEPFA